MSTMIQEALAAAATPADGLMSRTVILHLTIGGLGTKKRVRRSAVKVKAAKAADRQDDEPADVETLALPLDTASGDPDQAFVHVTKDIIQSVELTQVRKQTNAIRRYVRDNSVPSFLKGGMTLVRVDAIEEIDQHIERMKATLTGLVARFVEAYPRLVEDAREKLGDLYRAGDYPSVDEVRAAFTWECRLLTFSTPSTLRDISKTLFERERIKLAEAVESAAEDIKVLLRQQASDLLAHMVDRLTPGDDGKQKVFRASLVGNLAEFLKSFDARNVVDDQELAALMGQVGKMLEGVDATNLRKEEGLREAVRARAAEIKERLDGMVVARKRDITAVDE